MPSLPLTPEEEKRALQTIGVQSREDLFASIPPQVREKADFKFSDTDTGRGLSEHELRQFFLERSQENASEYSHFLGGGIYDNIIPAIVDQLVLRGEFLTCYTPYQPEVSQGTLQAIFEFQTLMARITGMEVANASLYDGATATAEAVLMAQRVARKPDSHTLIAASVPPDYLSVVQTFLGAHTKPAQTLPWKADGTVDLEKLQEKLDELKPSSVVIPYPNYFGNLEPLAEIKSMLPDGCLLIATISDPSALSIFQTPGELGVDIVVGEAQQLGTPMLFGGPHVGFLATQKKFLRQTPGRLVGETVDNQGKRAYALTLATREQHIRREKATSNICTNQGLIALRTTIYLSFLGKAGFIELGESNYSKFHYLRDELESRGIRPTFKEAEQYREGVFEVPNLKVRFQNALDKKIIPGIRLQERFNNANFENSLLVAVHPKHNKAQLDALVDVLSHG